MTSLSIFSRSRIGKLKEAMGKPDGANAVNDPADGGFLVPYWFNVAAKKISKAMDKGPAKECSKGSPQRQASNRLLGRTIECGCKECKEKAGVLKREKQSDVATGDGQKQKLAQEADSASNFATHQVAKEAMKFTTRKFLEASATKTSNIPTMFRVELINEGLGNFKDAYYYTKEALESAMPLFEGAKNFADHPSLEEEAIRPERSTRDILGHFEGLSVEKGDGGTAALCGTLDIMELQETEWARGLMARAVENAKKFPDKEFIGLSINASGESEEANIDDVLAKAPEGAKAKLTEAKEQGIETVKVVNKITSIVSCDLVTAAGAGGKILNIIEGEKTDGKEK